MTVPIIYRLDNAPRGVTGKGSNLAPADVDNNFYNLAVALDTIQGSLRTTVSIDHFIVSGTQFFVVMSDHSERGPYTLPTVQWNFRGVWQPLTAYAVNDVFTHGTVVYIDLLAVTSASTFDPGANDGMGHDYYEVLISVPNPVPAGGAVGTVLTKNSTTDFDATWSLPTLSGLFDVAFLSSPGLVAGQSLVFNGVHWTNGGAASVALEGLSDVSIPASPALASGSTLIWNGAVWGAQTLDIHLVCPGVSDTALSTGDVIAYDTNSTSQYKNRPINALQSHSGAITLSNAYLAYDVGTAIAVATTITIPTDASGVWSATSSSWFGAVALVGSSSVTIAASGVTLHIPAGRLAQTRTVGSAIKASKFGTANSWYVYGDLAFDATQAALGNTGTISVDLAATGLEFYTATPSGAITYNMANPQAGRRVTFILTTSGTSSFNITFGTGFKTTGVLATGTVTAKTFSVSFICDGTNLVETSRTTAM